MPAPDWIQHTDFPIEHANYGARTHPLGPDERVFCEGIARAVTIAESSDPNASYSYDNWALCELDGRYYAFSTSGCSCPSPSETWGLAVCGTKEEMLAFLVEDSTNSYYTSGEAFCEFLRQVEDAGWTLLTPARREPKYSW